MTTLYQDIIDNNERFPGWCPIDKALTLASLIVGYRPALTVEIGVYCGKSFFPMAMAHKSIGSGMVIGIDAWDTQVGMDAQVDADGRHQWSKLEMEKKFEEVLLSLGRLQLQFYAAVIRSKTDDIVLDGPLANIGLLHLDGAHNEQALKDFQRFAPRVVSGGFLVTDDTHWGGDAVKRAEAKLPELGFFRRYGLGTGAVYQRQ